MKSMTGFGSSEYQDEKLLLIIDVKSYNNRYLDISFNAPGYLAGFEAAMKERVKRVAARGHIEVNIRLKRLESDMDIMVDDAAVQKYMAAFKHIIDVAGLEERPHLTHFLHADDVMKMVRNQDASIYEELLLEQLDKALVDFEEAKLREGQGTLKDLTVQLTSFEEQFDFINSRAGLLEEKIKGSLLSKFEELTGGEFDENRILQEVAVLLMKYTINEEISRIASHIEHFKVDLIKDQPIGKRLDFLCQELNREINTIASKSVMVEVNQAVVSMKDNLENIREQLKNIE